MDNKKWITGISLGFCIVLSSASAHAAEYCNDKVDTISLRKCAIEDYKLEEDKINLVYQKLRAILSPKDNQRLKTAQLAWIDFRIKDCDFQTGWETGTIGPLMTIGCETSHTEDRRKVLEERLKSEREFEYSN